MGGEKATPLLKKIVMWYLSVVGVATVWLLYMAAPTRWCVLGDWLINYQGGWVRRGLYGEFLLHLGNLSGISPLNWAVISVALADGVYFYAAWRLLKEQDELLPYLWLIFSPYMFTFQLNAFALAYKKEILYFALVMGLTAWGRKAARRTFRYVLWVVLAIYPLLLLSHEVLVIFLPYILLWYFRRLGWQWKRDWPTLALLGLNAAVVVWTAVHHTASPAQIAAIQRLLPETCHPSPLPPFATPQSPVTTLGWSLQDGFRLVQYYVRHFHYLRTCLLATLLAVVGFVPLVPRLRWVWKEKVGLVLVGSSLVATVLLMVVALDWGRFVYIHLVSWFALTFWEEAPAPRWLYSPWGRRLWLFFALPYGVLWHLPCCSGNMLGTYLLYVLFHVGGP